MDLSPDLDLTTERFALAPLCAGDAKDLFAHFADPAVTAFMDIDPLADVEAARKIIAWAEQIRAARTGMRWAVRDANGAFVGTAGFNALVRERASRGEIAFDIVRARWRQGIGAEVVAALVAFGFSRLGLHRVEAMVTPGNTASCALLERLGFRCEGTLKDFAFWKGRYWDQHVYARLA